MSHYSADQILQHVQRKRCEKSQLLILLFMCGETLKPITQIKKCETKAIVKFLPTVRFF